MCYHVFAIEGFQQGFEKKTQKIIKQYKDKWKHLTVDCLTQGVP
jgi:hypothetical protein